MSNRALLLTDVRGSWKLSKRAVPRVTDNTVLVQVHAIALNPIDWKIREEGHYIKDWPAILGSDVAGVVEAVGANVGGLTVGDRVLGFARGVAQKDLDQGCYQEHVLLHSDAIAKIPSSTSFQRAATIPMAISTAAGALRDLGVNLPGAPPGQQTGTQAILIWGAGSSVGLAAVQLAHIAGVKVFATASPSHHKRLQQLGVDFVFDYRSPTVAEDIKLAVGAIGTALDKVFDAVSADVALTGKVLHVLGGGQLARLTNDLAEMPDDVKDFFSGARSALLDFAYSAWLYRTFIPTVLADGRFVPSDVEVIPGGLLGIEHGLEKLKAGVSGVKLVVEL